MLLAFLDTGTVAGYLTVAAVLLGVFFIWRGGGGTALATLETANRVLERRVTELERVNAAAEKELVLLRAKTDHVAALAPLAASIDAHEVRAQARAERTLVLLELIAARLGPDNGAATA